MAARPQVQTCFLAMRKQEAKPTCRLELMGLDDVAGYRRQARGAVRQNMDLFSGFNIPNKKPGEPLLEWASAFQEELPGIDLCVHYSLKHQRGRGDIAEAFTVFCQDVAALACRSVLLVTGPRGPAYDAVRVLEALSGRHPAPGRLRIGVAFNACLPTEAECERERQRLVRKLRTGLVEEVWLNTGSNVQLLATGAAFVRECARDIGVSVKSYGSALLPNEAQLRQMNEKPWTGVHLSERYLSSLEGMTESTTEVLSLFAANDVEPIIESKVRTLSDMQALRDLLQAANASRTFREFPSVATSQTQANRGAAGGKRRWVRKAPAQGSEVPDPEGAERDEALA